MSSMECDIVVIGAGHNALTTAAYLARAGLSVTVLEARPIIGGGTVTEELTTPGFHHDTFSTGHPWLLSHPIFTADELALFRNGLSYVGNDPVLVVPFADGESVTIWRDKERTAAELAHFSKRDAESWRDMFDEWQRLAPIHIARNTAWPADAPSTGDAEAEQRYEALLRKSCWEVVHERFENDHVRAAFLWFGMVVVQPIDRPGTGPLAISVPVGWSRYGWINVVGGSGRLAERLAQVVIAHGGRIVTDARVERIVVENGRAVAARTAKGDTYRARRAIVSSMHFTSLPETVAADLPADYVAGARQWRSGPSLFVVYMSVPFNPRMRVRDGSMAAVLSGQSTVAGVIGQLRNVVEERLTEHEPWMFAACSTWIDPSRAPQGQGTVKLTTFAPYALEGDPANWEKVKDDYAQFLIEQYARHTVNFRPGDELGRRAHTPVDIERINPSYHRGAPQGGEMVPEQMGSNRPVRGWADYRTPVAGLYQTGTSAHPGGPVSAWPGRNAARAVLEDLQIDWRQIMGAESTAAPLDIPVVDTSTL